MLFLRPIHNSLHSGFVLVFCLSFLLKGRHFVMLHKIFFHQITKQEKMTQYLPGLTLSGSFVWCNFMHYLFMKVFCIILIQKFQNYFLRRVTNTRFPYHLQTPTFQIISCSPRNTMRLDIPHYKIFTNAIQNLTYNVAYFPIT